MSNEQKWAYGYSEEYFEEGDLPSREAAIECAFDNDPTAAHCYVGIETRRRAIHFVSADSIIDGMRESTFEEPNGYGEDWLTKITDEAKKELEQLIADWTEKHDPPTWFIVEDVECIHKEEWRN